MNAGDVCYSANSTNDILSFEVVEKIEDDDDVVDDENDDNVDDDDDDDGDDDGDAIGSSLWWSLELRT